MSDRIEPRSPADRTLRAVGWGAVAVGFAGSVAVAFGPVVGVARVAGRDETVEAIGAAAAVAGVAAVAVAVGAAVAALFGLWSVSGGLLAGSGAVSVGFAVLDLQLFADPIDANRFELLRPLTAASLQPGPGAYVVLFGHVLAVIAGIAGIVAIRRSSVDDDSDGQVPLARLGGTVWSICTVLTVTALAVSLFPSSWRTTDPVIVAAPALDSPWSMLAGTVVVALGPLALAAAVLASTSVAAGAAALGGAGVAALGLTGSRWVSGLVDARLDASRWTIVGLAAAVGLVAVAVALPPLTQRSGDVGGGETPSRSRELGSASVSTWHIVAGACGLAAALSVGVGALLPTLTVPDGYAEPTIYATRTALVAAMVLAAVAVWLLLSEFANVVRPALGVLCAAAAMACAGVLQAVVEGQRIEGVGLGVGAILVTFGAVLIVLTGGAVVVAGSAERDDVDRSVERDPDRRLALLGGVGAGAGVIALALPLYRGSDASATSLAFPWGWDTWGQIVFAAAISVAAVSAAYARPPRAAALFAGTTLGMGIYLVAWPLTAGRVTDPTVGAGVPLAALAIVLSGAAAIVAARSPGRTR